MNRAYQTLLVITLTTIIMAAYGINAQLTNTAIIQNIGQISTTKIWAKSGTAEDIQAAVDAAAVAGGGIVYVPAGDFEFDASRTIYDNRKVGVIIPGGVSIIGAGKDKTNLTCITYNGVGSTMFYVDGSNDKPVRISGITFKGHVLDETSNCVGYGIYLRNCKKFRVDHCRFLDFPGAGIGASCYTVAVRNEGGELQYYWNWGLIDHCDFDNPYKDTIGGSWGYGVGVHGPGRPDAWLYNLSDILGKWDIESNPIRCALYEWNSEQQKYVLVNPYGGKYFRWLVYIEDCTFNRCRHGIASNNEAFYVARHCTFTNPRPYCMIDVHGAMGVDWWGGRGAEIYENTIDGAGYSTAGVDYRGGGGVCFNNLIKNIYYGVRLSADNQQQWVCLVNDLWIWNNTFQNVTMQIQDLYNLYTEGEDYFLQSRPNYQPYPYPHPLTQVLP